MNKDDDQVDEVDCFLFKKLEDKTPDDLPGLGTQNNAPTSRRRVARSGNELATPALVSRRKRPLVGRPPVDDLPVAGHIEITPPAGEERREDNTDPDRVSATTTSDVNSNDDAVSIASRLSQLVYEQEVKLNDLSRSTGDLTAALRPAADHDKEANMKQVKSSGNLERYYQENSHQLDAICSPPVDQCDQQHLRAFSLSEFKFGDPQRMPEIQVNSEHQTPDGLEQEYNHLRRNVSSGNFLPERGNLKLLESSRQSNHLDNNSGQKEQPSRARSNTLGSRLMLNIQRSAWTLSDFDQTFNKDPPVELAPSSQTSDYSDSSGATATTMELVAQTSYDGKQKQKPFERQNSGQNLLLIKASRNALSQLSQQQQQQVAASAGGHSISSLNVPIGSHYGRKLSLQQDLGQVLMPSGRRASRTHSIGSFSSSIDSFRLGGLLSSAKQRLTGAKMGHDDDDDDDKQTDRCCCNYDLLRQYLPILDWLPGYNLRRDFLADLTAGLAVAVLNISTSLSAAVVAGTDLAVAFRSSIINTFVYALLCSSKHTSFGSWSIMSQMLLVSVRRALSDELILKRIDLGPKATWEPEEYEMWHMNIIIMYTFLIGLVQLVSGILNLGNILASFIPEALCSSMIAATAFTMAVGQLANMCGTTNKVLWAIERNTTELLADLKNPPVDITDLFAGLFRWVKQIALLMKYYELINMTCVIISISCVLILAFNQYFLQAKLKTIFKRNIFLPSELILLIFMIIISYWLDLSGTYQVATCGPIYINFELPGIPNLLLMRELWFDSLATALISFTMVYIMAKTYSNKLNYEVDCNQELIACGAGNLIGGLFDALPATASFSRTAGQVEAGGRTQMASIINCVVLVALAQLFGHHVALLPVCVMSATLFYGFVRMMARFGECVTYWRLCKVDFTIWLVTFVAILTLDMVNGFLYGFIFSLLTMLYRAQNRRCYLLGTIMGTSDVYVPLAKYPLAREVDNIKIFQFCGPIHYVSADLFERLLRQKTRVNVKEILREMSAKNNQQQQQQEKQPIDGNQPGEKAIKPTLGSSFNPRDRNLPTHIILDFSMISFIDSAGIHVITKIIEDYQRVNITIFLASLASHVASIVKNEPSLWHNYKERFYVTLADAVHCAMLDNQQQQQGPTICQSKNNRPQQQQQQHSPRSMSIISIN